MTKEEVIDLITDAGFGLLATTDGAQPHVRPMMPYLTDDGKKLLIALLGHSRSIKEAAQNPQVEVCFVDRKMWFARVSGKARISDNKENKELLWNVIPMLKQYFGGANDPKFVLMEIDIAKVEASTPHQKAPETISIAG